MMIAFSVQRSSDGNLCDFQLSLSLGNDKNSIKDSYDLNLTLLDLRLLLHTSLNNLL